MSKKIAEDMGLSKESIFMRNMRKMLAEEGYVGETLENEIKKLMKTDVSRVARIIIAEFEKK